MKHGEEVASAATSSLAAAGKNARAETMAANRAAGKSAELTAKTDLESEGHVILGSQVSVNTANGRRVVDHLAQKEGGPIVAVEVKPGNATRSTTQRAKDDAMATAGTITGRNAPQELRCQTMPIETIEKRVPSE